MKYYKLYLQTKEGKFFSAYQPEYSLEYELRRHYTWKEMKIPEATTKVAEEEYPDAYWCPIFGLAKKEHCLLFLKEYFPCEETLQEDLDIYAPDYFRGGMKPVIVECEGELWDVEDPVYGIQEVEEWESGEEIMFKSQTILRVVEEITREQIDNLIIQAWQQHCEH